MTVQSNDLQSSRPDFMPERANWNERSLSNRIIEALLQSIKSNVENSKQKLDGFMNVALTRRRVVASLTGP